MQEYNPKRVVLLRQVERLTQEALSEKTGISQGTISKIENRQIELTDAVVAKIAMAFDYPTTFFTDSSETLAITSLTYRHTSNSSIGELNAIAAEYSMLCGVADQLSSNLNIHPKTEWIDDLALREDPSGGDVIEKLAEKTRDRLGLPSAGNIGNLTRALERVGIIVAPLHSLISKQKANLNSDGVTMPTREGRSMPVIGYSIRNNTGDRLRFTIAHELGHLVLHKYRKPANYREMEREAHRYAGALLMPQADAKILLDEHFMLSDLVRLKASWGMSIAAMVIRASNLGIIGANRTRSLQIQINSRGWRKQEPVHVGNEHPILMKQIMTARYADGNPDRGIDTFTAEKELNVPFRYLDQWSDGLKESGDELGFSSKRFEKEKVISDK